MSRKAHGLAETLAHLYGLEINCGLSSFWDGGWEAWIGDEMNGCDSTGECLEIADIPQWLRDNAAARIRHWRHLRDVNK